MNKKQLSEIKNRSVLLRLLDERVQATEAIAASSTKRRAAKAFERHAIEYSDLGFTLLSRHCLQRASECYAEGGQAKDADRCHLKRNTVPEYWSDSGETTSQGDHP